jgi:hypothetical protein
MSNAAAKIDEGTVLSALHSLQPEQWPEVLDFIGYLRHRNISAQSGSKQLTAIDLARSDLVGMWSDRSDIEDSLNFARQLRRAAEHRTSSNHDLT